MPNMVMIDLKLMKLQSTVALFNNIVSKTVIIWVIKLITSHFSGEKHPTLTVRVAASLLKLRPFCHVTSFHFTLPPTCTANVAAGKICNFIRCSGGREHKPLDLDIELPTVLDYCA